MSRAEYNRQYYLAHRDNLSSYTAEYRKANAEHLAKSQRIRYSDNQKRYADRQCWIKQSREKMGWSQEGLARALGVTQAAISRLETGATPLDTFAGRDKLYEVLGVRK